MPHPAILCCVEVATDPEVAEVHVTPDARGGPECLWFSFRLVETEPEKNQGGKIKLVLRHFENMTRAGDPLSFRPVFRAREGNWFHMRPGRLEMTPDGRHDISWMLEILRPI